MNLIVLFTICAIVLLAATGQERANVLLNQTPVQFLISNIGFAAGVLLTVPWIHRRPYRKFCIVMLSGAAEPVERTGTMSTRLRLGWFLIWRLALANLASYMLLGPLTILMALFRLNIFPLLSALLTIFGVGPVVMKFLIGNPFKDFILVAKRDTKPLDE
ncbi:MAG: hypothetical protein ABI824_03850 [Acidobacteriota bacterium]